MRSTIIERLFEKGVLVHKDFLDQPLQESLLERIEAEADILVLNSDYAEVLSQSTSLVDWYELDGCRVEVERERDDELYQSHLREFRNSLLHVNHHVQPQELSNLEVQLHNHSSVEFTTEDSTLQELPSPHSVAATEDFSQSPVSVIISFQNIPKKYEVKDFTSFFISRYHFIEKILRNRQELQNILTINRVLAKSEREAVSIIGVVVEIAQTKTGNLMITIEDLTGQMRGIVTKSKADLFNDAKELVVDEVIGLCGTRSDKIMFIEKIIWPDVPASSELKKKEGVGENDDEYAIFLSDIHVGSALFLGEEFDRFLHWINGNAGNEEQREMAQKVKYIFMVGDLVDGVGIYPTQESELAIKDIVGQYAEFTRLVKKIPTNKQIIMCPGNHDVVHIAEPQPAIYQEYAPELTLLPNVTLVTNPAMVNIGKTDTFSGFDVLMYHGYSFDYYVAHVESIRNGGGYQRADLIMKFLLKRRHLAPAFKSTPYFPGHSEDPLLIKRIPDFFVTGHIHYSSVANYKGITMISCSCWQGKTTFQEKLGHKPEPARLPIVNLRTREIKVLRFG